MELNLKVTKESHYATGKRKESVARVWVLNGSGKISVNEIGRASCRERV